MKLLYCTRCGDLFKLPLRRYRSCECGLTGGCYSDLANAVVNGQGISVAIGNGSLAQAIARLHASGEDPTAPRIEVLCWVRPHEGPRNPHTRVVPRAAQMEV